jgi:hypothetical protein
MNGILSALWSNGIPVKVVTDDSSEDDKRSMALALEDTVIATDFTTASGLERQIVIGLGTGKGRLVTGDLRLHAMSRCTSQLVWIDGCPVSMFKKNNGPGLPERKKAD